MKRWFWGLILLFFIRHTNAQVVINEIVIKNGNGLRDEDGMLTDWIELYNLSSFNIDITGYHISDGKNNWIIPPAIIPSHGFFMLYASGKNKSETNFHTNFKLSSKDILRLTNKDGEFQDRLELVKLQLDHSLGRYPDGVGEIRVFETPSPGYTNDNTSSYSAYAPNPVFSIKSGFYPASVILQLSSIKPGYSIRFTMDGKEPNLSSMVYTNPLVIDKTTVIKAKAWGNANELPSEIVTNTYFIGYQSNLPVISISTDPDNLWDWNKGICVLGPDADPNYPYHNANYWKEWEIPIHMEFFDKNKNLGFEQDFGCKIHGGSQNRTRPMKSFRILAKKKYGKGKLNYPLFSDKSIQSFDRFVLRNGSFDFNRAQMRDAVLHKLFHTAKMDVDILDYQPAVVFLNGAFYGIEDIRERIDEYYLMNNYPGITFENIDLLKEDTTIVSGDYLSFNKMFNFITSNDMAVKKNYDSAGKMMDIHSLCDYFIAETAFDNTDWPYNNIKYWRKRDEISKWRYVLFDLDGCLGNQWFTYNHDQLGRILGTYGDNNKHVKLFKSLLNNQVFKTYFINRYADMLNTYLATDYVKKFIRNNEHELAPNMPLHCEKWQYSVQEWEKEMDSVVIPYVEKRPAYNRMFLEQQFKLKKQVDVGLNIWPPGSGTINLNTLENLPSPWTGIYFDGNPIQLKAVAGNGYVFKEWRSEKILKAPDKEISIQLNVDTDDVFTAYFIKPGLGMQLTVFPNPAIDKIKLSFMLDTPQPISVAITDLKGSLVASYDITDAIEGINLFEIDISSINNGAYFLKLNSGDSSSTQKLMIHHP